MATTTARSKPATSKTTPSRSKAANGAQKPTRQAGPKPTYQIVENSLFAQTSLGEIVIPFASITTRKLRGIVGVMDNELDALNYLCEEVFPPEVDDLPVLESVPLMMQFMEEIGQLFGASLGEAQGSSLK